MSTTSSKVKWEDDSDDEDRDFESGSDMAFHKLYHRQLAWTKQKEDRLAKAQEVLKQSELHQCTFVPSLLKKEGSKRNVRVSLSRESSGGGAEQSPLLKREESMRKLLTGGLREPSPERAKSSLQRHIMRHKKAQRKRDDEKETPLRQKVVGWENRRTKITPFSLTEHRKWSKREEENRRKLKETKEAQKRMKEEMEKMKREEGEGEGEGEEENADIDTEDMESSDEDEDGGRLGLVKDERHSGLDHTRLSPFSTPSGRSLTPMRLERGSETETKTRSSKRQSSSPSKKKLHKQLPTKSRARSVPHVRRSSMMVFEKLYIDGVRRSYKQRRITESDDAGPGGVRSTDGMGGTQDRFAVPGESSRDHSGRRSPTRLSSTTSGKGFFKYFERGSAGVSKQRSSGSTRSPSPPPYPGSTSMSSSFELPDTERTILVSSDLMASSGVEKLEEGKPSGTARSQDDSSFSSIHHASSSLFSVTGKHSTSQAVEALQVKLKAHPSATFLRHRIDTAREYEKLVEESISGLDVLFPLSRQTAAAEKKLSLLENLVSSSSETSFATDGKKDELVSPKKGSASMMMAELVSFRALPETCMFRAAAERVRDEGWPIWDNLKPLVTAFCPDSGKWSPRTQEDLIPKLLQDEKMCIGLGLMGWYLIEANALPRVEELFRHYGKNEDTIRALCAVYFSEFATSIVSNENISFEVHPKRVMEMISSRAADSDLIEAARCEDVQFLIDLHLDGLTNACKSMIELVFCVLWNLPLGWQWLFRKQCLPAQSHFFIDQEDPEKLFFSSPVHLARMVLNSVLLPILRNPVESKVIRSVPSDVGKRNWELLLMFLERSFEFERRFDESSLLFAPMHSTRTKIASLAVEWMHFTDHSMAGFLKQQWQDKGLLENVGDDLSSTELQEVKNSLEYGSEAMWRDAVILGHVCCGLQESGKLHECQWFVSELRDLLSEGVVEMGEKVPSSGLSRTIHSECRMTILEVLLKSSLWRSTSIYHRGFSNGLVEYLGQKSAEHMARSRPSNKIVGRICRVISLYFEKDRDNEGMESDEFTEGVLSELIQDIDFLPIYEVSSKWSLAMMRNVHERVIGVVDGLKMRKNAAERNITRIGNSKMASPSRRRSMFRLKSGSFSTVEMRRGDEPSGQSSPSSDDFAAPAPRDRITGLEKRPSHQRSESVTEEEGGVVYRKSMSDLRKTKIIMDTKEWKKANHRFEFQRTDGDNFRVSLVEKSGDILCCEHIQLSVLLLNAEESKSSDITLCGCCFDVHMLASTLARKFFK
eukprot:TRINITY_DN5508_c0_g1_i1.p1 TRINITY_DN5508_c0_g1~~TRINITY_DN5508_c0_g1_i1.p1  ORF type:complete len:1275 (-),score=343.78 TRINITY_DN5508_c0_g1_i1:161-3985(-)